MWRGWNEIPFLAGYFELASALYGRLAHTPVDSFDKFYKQKSYQFAVLPVCMLILILQLPFPYVFSFYVPL